MAASTTRDPNMSKSMQERGGTASDQAVEQPEEWDVSDVEGPPARDVPQTLSLDIVFDMLKNERRRRVMRYLYENDGPFTLGELAEHIAALENDKSIAALSSGERKRVYVGLYQCHLPRMDDAGVIEFDRNRGSVELGPNAEALDEYLEVDGDEDTVEWSKYYLGISVAGGLLFLALEATGLAAGWASTLLVVTLLSVIGTTSYVQHSGGVGEELLGDRLASGRSS